MILVGYRFDWVLDVRQFYVVFDKKHITQDLRPLSRQQQLTKDKTFVTSDSNSLKVIIYPTMEYLTINPFKFYIQKEIVWFKSHILTK